MLPTGMNWGFATPVALVVMLMNVPNGHAPANPAAGRASISVRIPPATPLPTLVEAVRRSAMPTRNPREIECLARTVYFEARGDVLEGQLAVARTVINRTQSDLFPDSICAVVRQESQFSFVRDRVIPEVDRSAPAWRTSVAIALIARKGWPTRAGKALFFHAPYKFPKWRLARPALGRIGAHLFYS